jgi:hypothetical protein
MRRRTKVVFDDAAVKRFSGTAALLTSLVDRYKVVYTTAELRKGEYTAEGISFVDLSEKETAEAEDLAERFGIVQETAKQLILCRRLRAKRFVTGVALPEELMKSFRGMKIVSVEDEVGLQKPASDAKQEKQPPQTTPKKPPSDTGSEKPSTGADPKKAS